MRPIAIALLAALLAAPLQAAPEMRTRSQPALLVIETPVLASRVDGWIEVGAEGSVVGYEPITVLGEPLATRVKAMVRGFRFEPVVEGGRAVVARARMRLALVASELPDKSLRVSIENVTFPDPDGTPSVQAGVPRVVKKAPMRYPEANLPLGLAARVLVMVNMDGTGAIRDVAVRQSALLHARGSQSQVQKALAEFETAALRSISRWQVQTERVPGSPPAAEFLTGLVVVEFTVTGSPRPRAGMWVWETRSAARPAPWADTETAARMPGVGDVSGQDALATLTTPRLKLTSSPRDAVL